MQTEARKALWGCLTLAHRFPQSRLWVCRSRNPCFGTSRSLCLRRRPLIHKPWISRALILPHCWNWNSLNPTPKGIHSAHENAWASITVGFITATCHNHSSSKICVCVPRFFTNLKMTQTASNWLKMAQTASNWLKKAQTTQSCWTNDV